MKELYRSPDGRCLVIVGDITTLACDAIVNAANSGLLGGGGVDGAIHRAGGPTILTECRALRAGPLPDGLPPGQAIATTAGRLPAKRVIHTVGPIWHGGSHGEDQILASCYRECLRLAARENLVSIAFPAISTGVYGFPKERAARIAWRGVREFIEASEAPDRADADITSKRSSTDATPKRADTADRGEAPDRADTDTTLKRADTEITSKRAPRAPHIIYFVFFSEDDGRLFLRANEL